MVAWRHKELAENLKPFVTDDMVIVLSAGNFGSIIFKRTFGPCCKAVVGETLGNMFSCRMVGDGEAISAGPYKPKSVAAFPAQDTPKLTKRFSQYYPCTEAKNVFETALNAPNVICHLPGALLNTCAVERDPDFALYRQGLSRGVINCQIAVETEKRAIMEALGYKMVVHTDYIKQVFDYNHHPEFYQQNHLSFRQVVLSFGDCLCREVLFLHWRMSHFTLNPSPLRWMQ